MTDNSVLKLTWNYNLGGEKTLLGQRRDGLTKLMALKQCEIESNL
jgi:hypothetical protein